MADRKNIITLGIGASPGSVTWFITSGLESAPVVVYTEILVETRLKRFLVDSVERAFTVDARGKSPVVDAPERALDLTAKPKNFVIVTIERSQP